MNRNSGSKYEMVNSRLDSYRCVFFFYYKIFFSALNAWKCDHIVPFSKLAGTGTSYRGPTHTSKFSNVIGYQLTDVGTWTVKASLRAGVLLDYVCYLSTCLFRLIGSFFRGERLTVMSLFMTTLHWWVFCVSNLSCLWLIVIKTFCRPNLSVILLLINKVGLPPRGLEILWITRMITDLIGLDLVLLQ